MLIFPLCFAPYLLPCLVFLVPCLFLCLSCLFSYVLSRLTSLVLYVFLCHTCPKCFRVSRALVPHVFPVLHALATRVSPALRAFDPCMHLMLLVPCDLSTSYVNFINDVVWKTFISFAKSLHRYLRMKHVIFLNSHFILLTH